MVAIICYLLYWKPQIKNIHHKIISVSNWITYFSFSFICGWVGSNSCYVLWCKKSSIMSTTLLLFKTSWTLAACKKSLKKIELVFLLDLFLHYWFLNNLRMSTEWDFTFLKTVIITFCFIYSLNMSHSSQNP